MITIFLPKRKIYCAVFLFSALLLISGILIITLGKQEKVALATVYQGSDKEKKISLIFSVVWGEEFIPPIIECLKEYNVTATFFLGGQWADDFPQLAGQIAAGNEVGNHGYAHLHQERLSKEDNITEIKKAETSIFKATGIKTNLFAPPYGEQGEIIKKSAVEAGYTTIFWSIDTIDWQRPDPSVIVSRVLDKAQNGAIVLMHPTAPTVQALPQIIKELKRQGYDLVKVSVLLQGLKEEGGSETGSQNSEYRIREKE